MKYVLGCLGLLAVILLPAGANAQNTRPAHGRADTFATPNRSSVTDHPSQKTLFDLKVSKSANLNRNLQRAIYNQSHPPYFADGYVRKMCEQVKGCPAWAAAEYEKDKSFSISYFEVEHDCTAQLNGRKVVKHQYSKFMYSRKNSAQQIKKFTLANVPLDHPQCINCKNVPATCQPDLVFR